MKFHKDVKSPQETVLHKKRIVSNLQKRGEANKGYSPPGRQRGKLVKYSVKETNEKHHQEEVDTVLNSLERLRMQMGPSALHQGGPLNVSATKCTPRQLWLLHFSISTCSLLRFQGCPPKLMF